MIAELLGALFLGILIGIFTGLAPGIHVNLVAAAMMSISPILLQHVDPLVLCVFIMALAVTHSYHDTIPSIFLGAPENENSLAVLPGQKMLLKGEGYQAVKITIAGTFIGMCIAAILIPVFILTAKFAYPIIKPYVLYVLVGISAFMVLKEKDWIWSLFLFLLSGAMGILVFNIANLQEPLFPMLSGLFGISGLIISYIENARIIPQKIDRGIDLKWNDLVKAVSGSTIGVLFIQFFPGLGPAHGAIIASQVIKEMKDKLYLALVGAMGTMSVIFSLVTFYTLGKAKDGSIVVISELLTIDFPRFLILLSAMLIAGACSVISVMHLSRLFCSLISRVNYRQMVLIVISMVTILCILISGMSGLLVLVISTAIGLIAPLKGIGRNHAMGCLILPVILYFLL